MASRSSSTTKPKGRKRKLLSSAFTEFSDPHRVKDQQSRDKLDFSGTSDVETESFSDPTGQKNRINLLDVPNFHGDSFPLSQAGKFIPKFQTKVIRKSKTPQITVSEDVRKKVPHLINVCGESKCSEAEILDLNLQQFFEIPSINDITNSKENSETDKNFNEESKEATDYTSDTIAALEISHPLKKKLNLSENYEHDELYTGTSEHLSKKKKGKGRLNRMSEKTLGIRKAKSTATSAMHMNTASNACSTNGMEGEYMTSVDSLESEVVSETSVNGDNQNKSVRNSEESNLHPDNISNMIDGMKETFDWINNRIETFDPKLSAAEPTVDIERLKFSQIESNGSNFPLVQLHAALNDEIKNDCSMADENQSDLNVKSASTGQHQLDIVTAGTEFHDIVNSHIFLCNSRQNSEADNSCPKMLLELLSATMPATCTTYDQEALEPENLPQHSIQTNFSNCKAKVTLPNEADQTIKACTESDILQNAEMDLMQNIKLPERSITEADENGENQFVVELGSSPLVGKRTEMTTQLQNKSDLLLQKPSDLGQETDRSPKAVQSAHQELYSTFDDFPDVTDSQMYLLDEESVTKSTSSSLKNVAIPSTGLSCPGLANLSRALDAVKSAASTYPNEAKRREGSKILQNLIKELTSVNAQLIRYRRQIEKAKKERIEHLRSNSCARQY